MSTYYHLVCDAHRETMMAATSAGAHKAGGADIVLGPFVYAHRHCHVRIASEHDLSIEDYDEWDDETLQEMCARERSSDDGTATGSQEV